MKRIYFAVFFMISVLTISAVEVGYVSAKVDSYISKIELIDKQIRKDNFEDAIKMCNQLEERWYESAKPIDTILIHDYVDRIGESISKMRAYAENGGVSQYFAESTSAKKQLASIKESEYPYIENIL